MTSCFLSYHYNTEWDPMSKLRISDQEYSTACQATDSYTLSHQAAATMMAK